MLVSRNFKPRTMEVRRKSGLALVEMALVLPLLIFVLAGIVQFGGLFYLQNKMINLARDAARRLSVGEITTGQAQTDIQDGLSTWNVNVTATIVMPVPNDPIDNDVEVTIRVPKSEASLMDIFGMFQSGDLIARVVMREEAT
jgi:hypothetical protein